MIRNQAERAGQSNQLRAEMEVKSEQQTESGSWAEEAKLVKIEGLLGSEIDLIVAWVIIQCSLLGLSFALSLASHLSSAPVFRTKERKSQNKENFQTFSCV